MKLVIQLITVCILLVNCSNESKKTLSFRYDESQNGYYTGQDINDLEQKWSYKTGSTIRSTPLINNNTVYVGSGDSNFYAFQVVTGKMEWKFKAAAAINSSPALHNGVLFFQDKSNTLYAIDEKSGKENWQLKMGTSLPYEWGFDYYLSSPSIADNNLFIGSGDGNLYSVNPANGTVNWKFNGGSLIRSTPTYAKGLIYFGNINGKLYCIDATKGTKTWQFNTIGDTLNNEKEGFDRKAIIATPVIKDGIVITGSRDGYLYALDADNGLEKWKYNYDVSWVISSVAIKDSIVISGTSDGKVVNALNLYTGQEIWKAATSLVWASPVIIGNTVLTAQYDGNIFIHDLYR